jgi:hypothetical protein
MKLWRDEETFTHPFRSPLFQGNQPLVLFLTRFPRHSTLWGEKSTQFGMMLVLHPLPTLYSAPPGWACGRLTVPSQRLRRGGRLQLAAALHLTLPPADAPPSPSVGRWAQILVSVSGFGAGAPPAPRDAEIGGGGAASVSARSLARSLARSRPLPAPSALLPPPCRLRTADARPPPPEPPPLLTALPRRDPRPRGLTEPCVRSRSACGAAGDQADAGRAPARGALGCGRTSRRARWGAGGDARSDRAAAAAAALAPSWAMCSRSAAAFPGPRPGCSAPWSRVRSGAADGALESRGARVPLAPWPPLASA